jgi:hypothetical protein
MISKPFMLAWLGSARGVAVAVGDGVDEGAVVGTDFSMAALAPTDSLGAVGSGRDVAVASTIAGMMMSGCPDKTEGAGKAVGRGVVPISSIGSINGIRARRTRYSPGSTPTTLGTAVKPPITNISASTINETMNLARLLITYSDKLFGRR